MNNKKLEIATNSKINVLIIDNYDSFTYNLYQLCGLFTSNITIIRNDELRTEQIAKQFYTHIIISPGPGHPKDSGICEKLIKEMSGKLPILGVCLGHQAICEVFDAEIIEANEIVHGKSSNININADSPLFTTLPENLQAARYHSLVADPNSIDHNILEVIGKAHDGEIMAVHVRDTNTYGVQFHPESILTPLGSQIIENFLNMLYYE